MIIEAAIIGGIGYIFFGKKKPNVDLPLATPSCKTIDNVTTAQNITTGTTTGATTGASAGPYGAGIGAALGALTGASSLIAQCGPEWEKKLNELAKQGVKWAQDELNRIDKARRDAQNAVLNAPKHVAAAAVNGTSKAVNTVVKSTSQAVSSDTSVGGGHATVGGHKIF